MTISVSPTQTNAITALRAFLTQVLPASVEVVLGQANRVPEPKATDFVVMTPTRRRRLATNTDSYIDCRFVAAIAADVMTVSEVSFGALKVGSAVFGVNLTVPTTVTAFLSGSGGVGTYRVSPSQSIAEEVMAAGVFNALQPTEVTIQLDVHGPGGADNAQIVSTLLRDDYGVRFFSGQGIDAAPLYADDPKQLPFINDQNQFEDRWVVEACLQANEIVLDVPQQFADTVVVGLIDVDAVYPP